MEKKIIELTNKELLDWVSKNCDYYVKDNCYGCPLNIDDNCYVDIETVMKTRKVEVE